MKKLIAVMFVLCLTSSVALAQVDQATGTVTNDETQGMLRVNNCVFGGPNVDVLVSGEVAVNGSVPLTDLGFVVSGYLYLTPGPYSVAVVPTGEGVEEALLEPVDVSVEAGHRYTVAVLGQADEPSHTPLVIDEMAAYQAIGALPSENTHIFINNIRGVSGIDVSVGGEVRLENVPYGGYKVAVWPAGVVENLMVTVSGTSEQMFPLETIYNISATNGLECSGGTYPGTLGEDYTMHPSGYTSALNTVELLQVQNEVAAQDSGHPFVFNTFLNAIETAGLTELLTTGSPYMLLAPTDEAFEALPKEELDALMADPEALADLLRAHIFPGYYPFGRLGQGGSRTNLLDSELVLTGGGGELSVNGVPVGSVGHNTMVANGSHVFFVTKLLMPPAD
ncbi:MAG: fasciclin domain-containing protein [Deinococcota bacterium]|jgi:uncharacterized surface protein with fasciclin (FAS1) repeats|nr:fasciclin domain-containing protein [Deinococcota bacterium]